MGFERGPHIRVAVICETVIERKDGVLSLINIVDRWTVETQGTNPPEKMPPFNLNANLVLSFNADQARGAHMVNLELEDAGGLKHKLGSQDIHMEPGRSHNLVVDMKMQLHEPGRYWIWVGVNDQFMTKVPVELIYLRAQATPSPSTPPTH